MNITDFKFLSPAILRWEVGFGEESCLEQPFSFSYKRDGVNILRVGPTDPLFRFDGASVPESLQWLIHKLGEHTGAALAHDCAYFFGKNRASGWKDIYREEADKLFREALYVSPGVQTILADTMFNAVVVWGKNVWDDGTSWGGVDTPETDPENPQDMG